MEDQVVKGIRGKFQNESAQIQAKAVVGADGPFSRVRAVSGLDSRLKFYKDTYLVAYLPGPTTDASKAWAITGRGISLGVVSFQRDFTYIFWFMAERDHESLKKAGIGSLRRRLLELEPNLQPALENLSGWDTIAFLRPVAVLMRRWTRAGLALVGDAAHAMNPSIGQGLNRALVDALVLSRVLEDCKRHNDFSYNAIRRYEDLRHKQVAFYQQQSDLSSLFVTNNRFLAWLRNRAMTKLSNDRDARLLALKIGCGLLDELSMWKQLSSFL